MFNSFSLTPSNLKANGFTIFKSEEILSATPGYCTFTASFFPFKVAWCTCPIEAALVEIGLKVSNIFSGDLPKLLTKVRVINGPERGGALYCDCENLFT